MKKYKIYVNEKVEFNHAMVIEIQEDKNIDNILDEVQDGSRNVDDVKLSLLEQGCKIVSFTEDGSGNGEIEIDDLEEL